MSVRISPTRILTIAHVAIWRIVPPRIGESIDTILAASEYFRLDKAQAETTLSRMRSAVAKWRDVAVRLGISRRAQEEMAICFERG